MRTPYTSRLSTLKFASIITRTIFAAPCAPRLFPLSLKVASRRERGEDRYPTIDGAAARVKPIDDNWRFTRCGESRRGKNLSAKASERLSQLDNDRTFSDEELSASAKEVVTSESPIKSFCRRKFSSAAVWGRLDFTLARYSSFSHLLSRRKFPMDSKAVLPRLFAFNRIPETLCLRPSSEQRYLKSSMHPSSPSLLWRRINQATVSLFESVLMIFLAPARGCPESAVGRLEY